MEWRGGINRINESLFLFFFSFSLLFFFFKKNSTAPEFKHPPTNLKTPRSAYSRLSKYRKNVEDGQVLELRDEAGEVDGGRKGVGKKTVLKGGEGVMGSPSLGLIGFDRGMFTKARKSIRRREKKTDVVDSCTPSTFAGKT